MAKTLYILVELSPLDEGRAPFTARAVAETISDALWYTHGIQDEQIRLFEAGDVKEHRNGKVVLEPSTAVSK